MARNEGSTITKAITKLRTQQTLDLAKGLHQAQMAFLEKIGKQPELASTLVADLDLRVRDILTTVFAPKVSDA